MALKQINKQTAQFGRAGMLGFAGVGIICITQILTLQHLDLPLKFAVLCFGIAIPLLCASGLMQETLLELEKIEARLHGLAIAPGAIGCVIGAVGIASIFCHFSWIDGAVFIAAVLIAIWAMVRFQHDTGPCHAADADK
jgi:hypothetical protein